VKDSRLYLIHISECIARIEEYTRTGRDAFMQSSLLQDAVVRNLQVMGESTKHLPEEWKAAYPDVPWRKIIGFRNVVVHDYMEIDIPAVWEVVERDLSDLKRVIEQMLTETTVM
jgi:uncharacterized protein with HEPN domain